MKPSCKIAPDVVLSGLFASAHNPRFPAKPVVLIAGPASVAGEALVDFLTSLKPAR